MISNKLWNAVLKAYKVVLKSKIWASRRVIILHNHLTHCFNFLSSPLAACPELSVIHVLFLVNLKGRRSAVYLKILK
jgi:hypothetical protein